MSDPIDLDAVAGYQTATLFGRPVKVRYLNAAEIKEVVTFNVFGPNDPQAQRAIIETVNNAHRLGHRIKT